MPCRMVFNKHCKTQSLGIKATPHRGESTSFNSLLNSRKTFPAQWNPLPLLHSLLWLPLHLQGLYPRKLRLLHRYVGPTCHGLHPVNCSRFLQWLSVETGVTKGQFIGDALVVTWWHRKLYYLVDNTTTLAPRYGPEIVTCYNTGTKVCIRSPHEHYSVLLLVALANSFRPIVHLWYLWLMTGASTLHYLTISIIIRSN